ncbi:HAD family phosphatase [Clostridium sp. AM58-1XD]|uniref:HAD family hydrolase n=1 Tax=Clostridium sp. AM58-1XD TaxID=2292307 RepID=UPI000E551A6C|nr:HAD family phosphatase [Clostridium sp. AM58-1XD]RGY99900.1 HAD family phosphatase [Clostridium sp. AM58-1XD]
MIKNIVFDMGNVLVGYDAEIVCRHFIEDEEERARVKTAVFVSPEWVMLDMGVMKEEDAIEKMVSRLSSEHEKEMARQCFAHWHEYNMWGIDGMGSLIQELKANGYGIYLCSNASVRLLECYQDIIPGIELFDGVLFSAPEKCMKPQKEFYERLFERFDIKAEESFFIDDLQLNIDGAAACGMKGYCHTDADAAKLRKVLESALK